MPEAADPQTPTAQASSESRAMVVMRHVRSPVNPYDSCRHLAPLGAMKRIRELEIRVTAGAELGALTR
jgi:hypothetical protein